MPTIEAFLVLLDNYDSDVKHPEDHTSQEQAEEQDFLSKVMETRVMKKAYEFCSDKGKNYLEYSFVFLKVLFEEYTLICNRYKNCIICPGIFTGSVDDFRNYIDTIWFGLYDRGGHGAGSR